METTTLKQLGFASMAASRKYGAGSTQHCAAINLLNGEIFNLKSKHPEKFIDENSDKYRAMQDIWRANRVKQSEHDANSKR